MVYLCLWGGGSELGALMSALGQPLTAAEVEHVLHEFDASHDAAIDFSEFCAMFESLTAAEVVVEHEPHCEKAAPAEPKSSGAAAAAGESKSLTLAEIAELQQVFNQFDEDKSGSIGKKELKNLFKALGQKVTSDEAAELMKVFDEDRSGNIDFAEFVDLYQTLMSN